MGGVDDQAWLLMLAESTLRRFAERITEDLPDELGVLSQVQRPVTPAAMQSDGTGARRAVNGSGDGDAEQPVGAGGTGTSSMDGFAAGQRYRISFSQHYRQLLLACF